MTEFRHKITDALYDMEYYEDDGGFLVPETRRFPIVKRTDRYVYIASPFPWERDRGKLIRFSIADLERDGRDYNQANHQSAYTRPLPHWPLMPAEVRKPEPLALTP